MTTPTDCLFCKILSEKIPSWKVDEDTNHYAFLNINPASKGHALVIPKAHVETWLDMTKEQASDMFKFAHSLAARLKTRLNAEKVFVLIMGEEVPHAHLHLIPHYGGALPVALQALVESDLDAVLAEIGENGYKEIQVTG